MAQLARRDVWIVDVEVFELSKKALSFKETKGGIVLKNKKFLFDGGTEDSAVIVQDMVEVPPPPQVNIAGQAVSAPPFSTAGIQPHNQNGKRRPIEWVTFSPELHQMKEVSPLKLTPDKKYPVFEKKTMGMGETYVLADDMNREIMVSDKFFVPAVVQLFGDDQCKFTESPSQRDGGKLYWGGANSEPDMPIIRR